MDLVVTADDRTGALEVAARLADGGAGPVPVRAWPDLGAGTSGVLVVDLDSRQLMPSEAVSRVAWADRDARAARPARVGHKIDSTLRGNWAHELVTRSRVRPVLLVPALPAFGRVCVDGTVLDHGRPVHEGPAGSDARRRTTGSRPADLLRSAGASEVHGLAGASECAAWLAAPSGIAVADAGDDVDIATIVAEWVDAPSSVVLAGTSAVVGAVRPPGRPSSTLPSTLASLPPSVDGTVLVVCGSLHPTARAQVAVLEQRGVPTVCDVAGADVGTLAGRLAERGCVVLTTAVPTGRVDASAARATAAALADRVALLRRRVGVALLVVIGGDTAAAVLGDGPVLVHGSVGPGTAWATVGDDPTVVVTRSGGFGDESSLDVLLRSRLGVMGPVS